MNSTKNLIGICSGAANYLSSWDEQFSHIKALGFDALDFSLSDINGAYYESDAAMEAHCKKARAAAEKSGLMISQAHGPWPTDDTTPEGIKKGWESMHRAVYGCFVLGCGYLVIHPQMPFGWGYDTDPDYAENQTVALMKELMEDCEKYSVVLCLENMPFKDQRISPMKYIVRAVEKVGSPYAGICLDTGHCNFLNDDIAENVHLAKPYLKVLHLHDNKKSADSHLLPMLGSINWTAFAKALADIDFKGVLSLETGEAGAFMDEKTIECYEQLACQTARQLRDMISDFREQKK